MEPRCWSGGNGEIGVSWNAVLMTGINALLDTYVHVPWAKNTHIDVRRWDDIRYLVCVVLEM